jgi:predicted RNase H-like nuclease
MATIIVVPRCATSSAGAEEIGGSSVSVIAVDMPLAHEPVRARRCCDNAISRAFGERGCSTHGPTEQRPGKVSDALYEEAKAAGFGLKTQGSDRDGAALLEVYPHVALLALCRKGRRLPYKLSRRHKNFPKLDPARQLEAVRKEWNGILGSLKHEIDIAFDIEDGITTLRNWKAWEDVINAIVCCWVGLEWLRGRARAYGDEVAAIWVPEGESAWRASPRLVHSAPLEAYSRRQRSHRRRAGDEMG